METVDRNKIRREPGEGGSLVKVISMEDHSGVSFLKFSVRKDGFPPLKGTCIGVYYYRPVQCNRWCECGNCFRPFTGRKFFLFHLTIDENFSEEFKGGICCVSESRYEPEFRRS